MTRRPIRRRHRAMSEIAQIELMGCIMLTALIIGIVGGPALYILTHL